MILVDTSVLIDWLKGNENPKTKIFDSIVETSAPFGISALTYQEILQGAKRDSHEKLKSYLGTQKIYHLPDELEFYDRTADLYRQLRHRGKTIRSTIDLLIAMTAVHHELKLLHNDRDFDIIAGEIDELEILEG